MDFLKKIVSKKKEQAEAGPTSLEQANQKIAQYEAKMHEYYHRLLLLDMLLNRYGQHINEKEAKTVQDLKEMVQPDNTNIKELVEKLKKEDPDAPQQALLKKAFEFIRDEIDSVPSLGVNFWMTIKEMLDNSIADYEDKAIFLCSLFEALGADSRIMIAEFSGGSNRPLVLIDMKGSYRLCDPNASHEFEKYVGQLDDILAKYEFNGEKIVKRMYEFNDKMYDSHEEE
ncbi:MAG: hypothetical protein V1911_00020 [Candidatus Micrarchaeota archaeon]